MLRDETAFLYSSSLKPLRSFISEANEATLLRWKALSDSYCFAWSYFNTLPSDTFRARALAAEEEVVAEELAVTTLLNTLHNAMPTEDEAKNLWDEGQLKRKLPDMYRALNDLSAHIKNFYAFLLGNVVVLHAGAPAQASTNASPLKLSANEPFENKDENTASQPSESAKTSHTGDAVENEQAEMEDLEFALQLLQID